MIKHIVMWKFKEGTEEKQKEFLDGLVSLKGKISEIIDVEVGQSIGADNEHDAILVSTFASMADLEAYKVHPEHVKVAAICADIRVSRVAFDYETDAI